MSSPFNRGDRVVAYCRYSEGDEQGLRNVSTEEQADAIRKFCTDEGLELVQIFADPFASGRSVAGREHYLEMLSVLLKKKHPDIQGVVLWDYERYGRNYDRAQYDTAALRMAGYKLYSMQQPITDGGPFAKVLESMYFASAQNQSDMISADVRRALRSNFEKHKVIPRSNIPLGWCAVPVSMGYYSDGHERIGYKAEPDPIISPKIRQAINKRLSGGSLDDCLEILDGVFKTRWLLSRLFMKTLLYGSMTYGGVTITDYCEPIISRETFNALQVYNASQPHKTPRRVGAGAFSNKRAMLSGLLYCGVCGEPVYINRRKSKGHLYESYYCNHRHIGIRADSLEIFIITCVIDLLSGSRYEIAKRTLVEATQKGVDAPYSAEGYKSTLDRIDKQIDTLTEAIADAGAVRSLILKLKSLEQEREMVVSEMERADSIEPDKVEQAMDRMRGEVIAILKNEKSDTELIRTALSLFIQSITITEQGDIIIRHTLPGYSQVVSNNGECVSAPPCDEYAGAQLVTRYRFR